MLNTEKQSVVFMGDSMVQKYLRLGWVGLSEFNNYFLRYSYGKYELLKLE